MTIENAFQCMLNKTFVASCSGTCIISSIDSDLTITLLYSDGKCEYFQANEIDIALSAFESIPESIVMKHLIHEGDHEYYRADYIDLWFEKYSNKLKEIYDYDLNGAK